MAVDCRTVGLKSIFLLVVCLVLSAPIARSQEPSTTLSARDQMTLRMIQLAQAGRIPAAREVLRTYLAGNPTDGTMYYNLTCLDLYLKENDQALADLERALDHGYTNFRLIEADRDLAALRDNTRFIEMVARSEEKFREKFLGRTLYLDEGYVAEGLFLRPGQAAAASADTSRPELAVGFNSAELLVTIGVKNPHCAQDTSPWQGGCGVLVNLVQPVSPEDYESRRYFSFGFFFQGGEPRAVLIGENGKVLLEPRPALAPVITRSNDRLTYEIAIPWEQFTPYAPPMDQELGLNVFYLEAGEGPSRRVFSLMDEDHLSYEPPFWRRYVPVVFQTSDRTVPVLRGRLYERLAQGDSLGVQLVLWSNTKGKAQCRLSFHPGSNSEETVGTPVVKTFPCETELNFFNTYLGLQDMAEGSYTLRAEVTGPDNLIFTREFPFDNMESDWISSLNERVFALDTPEQSILKYHLFALARQAENRHPQDDASALHRARASVARMVKLCEAGSSCLPDSGLFRGGFTSDVMTQRFCAMFLPQGYRQWTQPQLLVALPAEPGSEDELARRLGAALAGQTETIVLVPQSHGYSSLATGKTAHDTALALQWARALFPGGAVTLVGLGKGTDAALETSLSHPELCHRVLLDGGHLYGDLNEFSAAGVQAALGDRLNVLTYTLASDAPGSPRMTVIAAAMKQLGFRVKALDIGSSTLGPADLASWFLATP